MDHPVLHVFIGVEIHHVTRNAVLGLTFLKVSEFCTTVNHWYTRLLLLQQWRNLRLTFRHCYMKINASCLYYQSQTVSAEHWRIQPTVLVLKRCGQENFVDLFLGKHLRWKFCWPFTGIPSKKISLTFFLKRVAKRPSVLGGQTGPFLPLGAAVHAPWIRQCSGTPLL